jgi:hypothetical protein|tara:strand:- start:1923 stop:2069 length:147 start_codon:yes stop_codon:yes gene_type:complete
MVTRSAAAVGGGASRAAAKRAQIRKAGAASVRGIRRILEERDIFAPDR